HRYGIDTYRVMLVHYERDLQLRPHTISARDQHRFLVLVPGQCEQPAESSDVSKDFRPVSAPDVVLHELHGLITGFHINTGRFVVDHLKPSSCNFFCTSAFRCSTFRTSSALYCLIFSRSSGCATDSTWTASSAAFTAPSTATVATGIPGGICTMDSSESSPSIVEDLTGTPMTGSGVYAARTPGRCAAFPAAAIITSIPSA